MSDGAVNGCRRCLVAIRSTVAPFEEIGTISLYIRDSDGSVSFAKPFTPEPEPKPEGITSVWRKYWQDLRAKEALRTKKYASEHEGYNPFGVELVTIQKSRYEYLMGKAAECESLKSKASECETFLKSKAAAVESALKRGHFAIDLGIDNLKEGSLQIVGRTWLQSIESKAIAFDNVFRVCAFNGNINLDNFKVDEAFGRSHTLVPSCHYESLNRKMAAFDKAKEALNV
ncbi:MAG: hypothetical protein IMZ57_04025 [Acidobacteria bacterium]|nr:hypothetical protein [Acidobacteriota bacterium]